MVNLWPADRGHPNGDGGLFAPWKFNNTPAIEQKAADSLSATVFKNRNLKVAALSDKKANYVPFFGSSELARMDLFHPSVMAARYHDYKPFLFGSRGTQSLPQLFNMAMMNKQLKNRKAVYIISPQWFVKQGLPRPLSITTATSPITCGLNRRTLSPLTIATRPAA